jgi:hypothetical protein
MATICAVPFKVPRIRVTRLDVCGTVVTDTCGSLTSDGVITVEIAREYEDREDFFRKNGDGVFCVKETTAPILKWINVTLTMCNVDPQLVNLVAGEPLVVDDAVAPNTVGYRVREGATAAVNFAFELWTRSAPTSCADVSSIRYGYALFPWAVEGTISDVTYQNGTADLVLTFRTHVGSTWGVGPYSVRRTAAVLNLGAPAPLLSAITSLDHEHWEWVTLPPPLAACGCVLNPPAVMVAADPGIGTTADLTLPTGTGVLPAYVDWGDASAFQLVSAGPTVNHVYAMAGTYQIRLYPNSQSAPVYSGSVTVV